MPSWLHWLIFQMSRKLTEYEFVVSVLGGQRHSVAEFQEVFLVVTWWRWLMSLWMSNGWFFLQQMLLWWWVTARMWHNVLHILWILFDCGWFCRDGSIAERSDIKSTNYMLDEAYKIVGRTNQVGTRNVVRREVTILHPSACDWWLFDFSTLVLLSHH